jgi:hypothetical protein
LSEIGRRKITQRQAVFGCWSLALCYVFTLVMCLATASAAIARPDAKGRATPRQEKAIKLTQMHNFMGGFNVLIARDGIRMQNTGQLGFILIARAPDWKVIVYRDDDKTYYSESLKELEDTGLFSSLLFTLKERKIDSRIFRKTMMKIGTFNVERHTSALCTLKFLPLAPYGAPQVERILYAVYKFPTNGEIPIGYSNIHQNSDFLTGTKNKGRFEVFLDTAKIENVMVSPAVFTLPPGLKKAKSLREVASGNKSRARSENANVLWENR